MTSSAGGETHPVEMSFDVADLISRIARALEIYSRKDPGAANLIERVHLEAVEIYPMLRHSFHMMPTGLKAVLKERIEELPNGAIPSVGVPLDEKEQFLRHMLAFMSGLPATIQLSVNAFPDGIEVSLAVDADDPQVSVSRKFPLSEAPWFARDVVRRRIISSEHPGTAIVKCLRCYSGVMPQKGKLWGWWCPTCGVRLVLE
jgi:hypothetical protein